MQEGNERVYFENGSTFKVRRIFDNTGASVLEQITSLLVELMEKEEK